MTNIRKLFFFMAMLTGMFALQGCNNDGPLEEAGEEIDDAVDDIADDIDDATD
jgi:predicted small lipoprotein YifL